MFRLCFLLLTAFLTVQAVEPQRGRLDPDFAHVPFDQWLTEKDQTKIHWKTTVPHAVLSFHQRLLSEVLIEVDGKDLEGRRADGKMVFLVQITDRDGTRFQSHSYVEFSQLDPNIKAANLEYSQRVFLVPGEYKLAVALLDTKTGEHTVKQSKFHVDSTEGELLTKAWRDLPPVEFLGKTESPDSWFLPDIQGRLQWAEGVHSAARMNILLNVAQSAMQPDTWRPMTRIGRYGTGPFGPSTDQNGPVRDHSGASAEMSALIPTLKALTQTGAPAITENVALLDLTRRKTVFEQSDVKDVDWPQLKTSLGQASSSAVDVHTLQERHHDAQYFVSEVRRVLRASPNSCVLVVLTNPVTFESGEDLEPISTEALPACKVFYIRYRPPLQLMFQNYPQQQIGGRRGGRMGGGPMMTAPHEAPDQLEATLKPLSPKVYDATTPDQVTKAFSDIEKSLASKD